MKKIIALFFLLLLSFQVMPVKELGALIAAGSLNEEIPAHGIDLNDAKSKSLFLPLQATSSIGADGESNFSLYTPTLTTHCEAFFFSFIGDIFSPPPNV